MHFPFVSQLSTSPGLLLPFGNDNNNHSIRETTEEHVFNDESIRPSSGTPNIPCKMILPPSSYSHLCDEEIHPPDGGEFKVSPKEAAVPSMVSSMVIQIW